MTGNVKQCSRLWLLMLLLALLPAQGLCAAVGESDAQAPAISPSAYGMDAEEERSVSLYFRMHEEDMLAREARQVFVPLDMTLEHLAITRLVEGPEPNLLELSGLFNPGTKVLITYGEGKLLTVLLSQEFLEKPADAPADWRQDSAWRTEVLMRRRLALLSIVNTVTECTDYTIVQLLVQEHADDQYGRRVERSEIFEDGETNVVLAPITRDESVILSAHNTAEIILECWQKRDYDRLYRFVADRPTAEEFRQEMLLFSGSLTGYSLEPGVVSDDGQSAMIMARLEHRDESGYVRVVDFPMQMVRSNSLWKITNSALLRLMEADG